MSLKRYSQFIKESIDDTTINLLVERGTFYEKVKDLDEQGFDIQRSFSDVCKTDNDPDEDFSKIQEHMDICGFTIEKVKSLFSDENNKKLGYNLEDLYRGASRKLNTEPLKTILEEVKRKLVLPVGYSNEWQLITDQFHANSGLDTENATVDIYLYKLFEKLGLNKNTISLGGSYWSDWQSGEADEAFIRYRYGYHTTKYGQLMIQQSGMTEDQFRQDALDYLQEYIESNLDVVLRDAFRNKFDLSLGSVTIANIYQDVKLSDYAIIEDDRYIIDLAELADDINDLPTRDNNKLGDKYPLNVEDIASEFTKNLGDLKIDILLVGTELVIYSKFRT